MDTIFGSYSWPETAEGDSVGLPCEFGSVRDDSEANATRMCGVGSEWMDPDYSQCAVTFDSLEDVSGCIANHHCMCTSSDYFLHAVVLHELVTFVYGCCCN